MSCFCQHASLPFTVPYQRKPPREGIFHSHGPNNPLLTLTFIFSRPFLLTSSFHAYPPPSAPPIYLSNLTSLQGEQVGRLQQAPHLYPETHKFAHTAVCQRCCFTDWIWGGCGGMTKTTACVGEYCLRLRLEIFSGKTGFYTQWSWVWRKGAHIKRSASIWGATGFKLHLNGKGPICSFFFLLLGYSVTDWIKNGFPDCPCFPEEQSWNIHQGIWGKNSCITGTHSRAYICKDWQM